MSKSGEATVYGAGMSGLIAAINLAREGYSVKVHEKEPGYGGASIYNPSTHVTPIDPVRTSEYIGIDITPVFHPVPATPAYFHGTKVMFPVYEVFAVERGDRPTSLDTLLFEECKGLDIEFHFGSPLREEDLSNLPPNTIIACGLTPSVYEMLEIPYLRWYGWISRGEIDIKSYALLWWDECISEYGYFSAVNGFYFDLLFSIREVTRECLEKYKRFLVRYEGIEHRGWEYISGAVPLAVPDNPRLFWKGAVMCGTISGAMDPLMWFGISGALVTGKVAALAVTDPEQAKADFRRFTRRFAAAHFNKNKVWYRFVRPNVNLIEKVLNTVGAENFDRFARLTETERARTPFAIPGYSHVSVY